MHRHCVIITVILKTFLEEHGQIVALDTQLFGSRLDALRVADIIVRDHQGDTT